jgi:hypothetical protein
MRNALFMTRSSSWLRRENRLEVHRKLVATRKHRSINNLYSVKIGRPPASGGTCQRGLCCLVGPSLREPLNGGPCAASSEPRSNRAGPLRYAGPAAFVPESLAEHAAVAGIAYRLSLFSSMGEVACTVAGLNPPLPWVPPGGRCLPI